MAGHLLTHGKHLFVCPGPRSGLPSPLQLAIVHAMVRSYRATQSRDRMDSGMTHRTRTNPMLIWIKSLFYMVRYFLQREEEKKIFPKKKDIFHDLKRYKDAL